MSAILRRTALRSAFRPAVRPARQSRFYASSANAGEAVHEDREAGKQALKGGAKRDPELYVLLAIMSGAFGLAGWYLSSSPTSASSEASVSRIEGTEPWKSGIEGKYQYHPGGDPSAGRKEAPSALNVVIVPNVNLPKELHEKYNKYGKEGYP